MKTPTFQQKPLSRQRLWQIKQRELGKCGCCAEPAFGKALCPKCYERDRVRLGCVLRRPEKVAWTTVDWTQPDSVIAKQMGVTRGATLVQRKKRGIPPPPKWWASIDWSKTDKAIALETKRSIFVVYRARALHGTKSPLRTRWETVDWSKSNTEIAIQFGVAPQTVGKNREKYANKTP